MVGCVGEIHLQEPPCRCVLHTFRTLTLLVRPQNTHILTAFSFLFLFFWQIDTRLLDKYGNYIANDNSHPSVCVVYGILQQRKSPKCATLMASGSTIQRARESGLTTHSVRVTLETNSR